MTSSKNIFDTTNFSKSWNAVQIFSQVIDLALFASLKASAQSSLCVILRHLKMFSEFVLSFTHVLFDISQKFFSFVFSIVTSAQPNAQIFVSLYPVFTIRVVLFAGTQMSSQLIWFNISFEFDVTICKGLTHRHNLHCSVCGIRTSVILQGFAASKMVLTNYVVFSQVNNHQFTDSFNSSFDDMPFARQPLSEAGERRLLTIKQKLMHKVSLTPDSIPFSG